MALFDIETVNSRLHDPQAVRTASWKRASRPRRVFLTDASTCIGWEMRRFLDLLGHVVVDAQANGPDAAHVLLISSFSDESGPAHRRADLKSLLARAEVQGIERVILLSSLEAAGPVMHDQLRCFESEAGNPVTPRGHERLSLEAAAVAWGEQTGKPMVILRAGHLYGCDRLGFFAPMLAALLRNRWHDLGLNPANRSFQPVHVKDLALAAALAVQQGNWIYTVSDGTHPTDGQLAATLVAAAQRTGYGISLPGAASVKPSSERIHFGHPHHRALRELGYIPQWPQGSGIDETLYALRLRQLVLGLSDFELADHVLATEAMETTTSP